MAVSASKRSNKNKQEKNTKDNKNAAKSYMGAIPVMMEPGIKSQNNKTIRRGVDIEVKSNKNIVNKEVENILYIKDIITPSSLSTPSSSTPHSESIVL